MVVNVHIFYGLIIVDIMKCSHIHFRILMLKNIKLISMHYHWTCSTDIPPVKNNWYGGKNDTWHNRRHSSCRRQFTIITSLTSGKNSISYDRYPPSRNPVGAANVSTGQGKLGWGRGELIWWNSRIGHMCKRWNSLEKRWRQEKAFTEDARAIWCKSKQVEIRR